MVKNKIQRGYEVFVLATLYTRPLLPRARIWVSFADWVIKNSWRVKANLALTLHLFFDQIVKTRAYTRAAVKDDTTRVRLCRVNNDVRFP
jgi:hypothetical protein